VICATILDTGPKSAESAAAGDIEHPATASSSARI
jgi:hypothetical protein